MVTDAAPRPLIRCCEDGLLVAVVADVPVLVPVGRTMPRTQEGWPDDCGAVEAHYRVTLACGHERVVLPEVWANAPREGDGPWRSAI